MSHITAINYSGSFGGSGSGVEDGESFSVSTNGTLNAVITHNADGSVSGTWSYSGSYIATSAYESEFGSVADSGVVSGTPTNVIFTAGSGVFVNGTGQLTSNDTALSFSASWNVPGGSGTANGGMSGNPIQSQPAPQPAPQKVNYIEGTVPPGFGMAPAGLAGIVAGQPLFPTSSNDKVYESITIKPDIWTAVNAAGDYIELTSLERVVSLLATNSQEQFDKLAPYFMAKAMLRSDLFQNYNLSQAFTLSGKLLSGFSASVNAIETLHAWSDTISNIANVYAYRDATGQWPSGVGSVGLDNWANELKQDSTRFIAENISKGTFGVLTPQEAQKLTEMSVEGWELIINGLIDAASQNMGLSVQTTQSFKFKLFVNEDFEGAGNSVRLTGGESADLLAGGAGNDFIYGGKGDDALVGGQGRDTAVFFSTRASNTLQKNSDGSFRIVGTEGTDLLAGIERLQFSDRMVALDLDGNAGRAVKFLAVLLGSAAWNNKEYIGVALSLLDKQTVSFEGLMQLGLNAVLGANASNGAVVNLLYNNLVGGVPAQADFNQLVALLDSGSFTPSSLAVAAAEHDINAANIGLVGLASTGIEYFAAS